MAEYVILKGPDMLKMNKALRELRNKLTGGIDVEEGFSLVELMTVVLISAFMLAGMVGVIMTSFDLFSNSKDLQAITDSSRRILGSMTRQIRSALYLADAECDGNTLTFYADVDNDQGTAADVDNYLSTEKVSMYLENNKMIMSVLEPDGESAVPAVLGSHVNELDFYYFRAGEKPELDSDDPDPTSPINGITDVNKNESVGMIRIVVKMKKNKVSRSFYQDVFLRVLDRVSGEE